LIGSLALAVVGVGAALAFSLRIGDEVSPDTTSAAVSGTGESAPLTGSAIFYAISRYTSQNLIEADHQPLCDYLERTLQRPFEHGEITLAALSASQYLPAKDHLPDLRLVATGANAGGDSYVGEILVKPSSGIESLEDLLGKDICYPSRESTSGYFYPRALLRQAGIDPDTAFRRESFHNANHVATLHALDNGECDAAAVYQAAVQQAGYPPEAFHVLASTPRIPNDAYVVSGNVPAEEARAIEDALLALEPGSDLAREVLANAYQPGSGQLRGFVPATDAAYAEAREIIQFRAEED
jgi:ABC-type phosphate/phosphonate transport system substrate-binding protein